MNAVVPSPDLRAPLLVSLAVHIVFIGVMGLSALPTAVISPQPKTLTLQLQSPLKTPQKAVLSTPTPPNPLIAAKTPTAPKPIVPKNTHKPSPTLSTDTAHIANTVTVNQATLNAETNDTPSYTTSTTEPTSLITPVNNQVSATTNEQAPIFDAAYLKNSQPSYPAFAKKRGQQGTVLLKVNVSIDGKPDNIQLQKSSGFTLLDQAAQNTVKTWHFVPAKQGNAPIDAWVIVPITFKLS